MNLAEVTRLEVLRMADEETHGWKLFIGGEWVDSASGERYETIDPSLDTPIAAVPDGNAQDIDAAVRAARAAFPAWSRMHVDERAKILRRFADGVRQWAREFGMLDAVDSGNPYTAMVDDAHKGRRIARLLLRHRHGRPRARRFPRPVAASTTRACSRSASCGREERQRDVLRLVRRAWRPGPEFR